METPYEFFKNIQDTGPDPNSFSVVWTTHKANCEKIMENIGCERLGRDQNGKDHNEFTCKDTDQLTKQMPAGCV